MFGVVIGANNLVQRVLSKRDIFTVTIIMTVGGAFLLSSMQYFSVIYVLGVLFLFLKWRRVSWLMSLVVPVTAQLLMVIANYAVEWFMLTSFGININTYDSGFGGPIVTMLLSVTVCNILVYLMSLLIGLVFRKEGFKNIMNRNGYIMACLLLITIVIIYLFIYLERLFGLPSDFIVVNTALFMILFLLVCMVFSIIVKIGQEQVKQKKQKQELLQLRDYTEKLELLNDEMSLFKHDYINILTSLHGYINNGNQQKLEEYFQNSITPLAREIESNKTRLSK
ncbi:hypothetical protein [Listeria grandensis]|nr:hypothetical protein [Listeria grandensis]